MALHEPVAVEDRERISFCRICPGGCGTVLTLDDAGHIARVRGDDRNTMSAGHACFKGLQSGAAHADPARLLHPLKRQTDGSYLPIGLEQALDEIAAKIAALIARDGPRSTAVFVGNGGLFNATANGMHRSFLNAIGSDQYFSTVTIDQSAKMIAYGRLGGWAAGVVDFEAMDVALLFGANPLIAHSSLGVLSADPVKRLKRARSRGMKLITVDPRRTETGVHADIALQPFPGQDAAICAGLIRLILAESWHDADFCAHYVGAERLAALREAVDPFGPDQVETRAGLEAGALWRVADLFARQSHRGIAFGGTGPNMSPFSNLAQHLIECLNVICGRYPRPGDPVRCVNMLGPASPARAEVVPASRPWEDIPPSRIRGAGNLFGERLSATLSDEILTPGEGRIRALIVDGGNPMTSLPDRDKAAAALRALDLLVAIEPWDTPTAREAHYVLPATLQYERADLSLYVPGYQIWPGAWAQFTPAVVSRPAGSELVDDWYVFWGIAKRLGRPIVYDGVRALDTAVAPTSEDLIALRLEPSQTSVDELRAHPHGKEFALGGMVVLPPRPEHDARFDVMPHDVAEELDRFLHHATVPQRLSEQGAFTHLLSVRRMRDLFNSIGTTIPGIRRRNPYNPAFFHGYELDELGLAEGDPIEIISAHGRTRALAGRDDALRRGVVALSHGWGGTPDAENPQGDGTCVNVLIDTNIHYETINAMPHMTALPVRIARIAPEEATRR